jgi:multidrug efflux pump subunit AcrA (membrane-fusion protein)
MGEGIGRWVYAHDRQQSEDEQIMKITKFLTSVPFVIIFALSLVLTACGPSTASAATPKVIPTVQADKVITSEGRVEPIHYAQIALNTSGLVSDVMSKEGDQAKAGQVIARLQNSQAQTLETAQADALQQLTAAYQAARDAQYKLDNFDVPGDFSDMTAIQAAETTLDNLNAARDAFEPYKNASDLKLQHGNVVVDTGVYRNTARVYKKRLDAAWEKYRKAVQWLDLESSLESAKSQLAQAQKDYDDLQDPSFAEDTAAARAALANAEVRAPFAGTLTNLDLKVGEFAASGQPVFTIADLSGWVVKTTDLTEIDVVNLSEGQPVDITLDAIPEETLKGNILSISQNYTERQGDIVYKVTVLLTDNNPALRWGMTAKVNFIK